MSVCHIDTDIEVSRHRPMLPMVLLLNAVQHTVLFHHVSVRPHACCTLTQLLLLFFNAFSLLWLL